MSFNLIYEKVCKSLIKEGGNAVPGVDRIKKTYINKTIKKFKKEIIDRFLGFDPENAFFLIGSTGKKPDSGDIDIALDANILPNKNIIHSLIKLNEICTSYGYLSVINSINYDMLHIAYPQVGNEKKKVQIDLLLTKFPEFTKFFMFSPTPKESKYKGAHRNELLHAICKVISFRPILKDDSGNYVKWSQLDVTQDGMYTHFKTLVDEHGNKLKYKNTDEDLEESYAKIEKEYPITHDPNRVIFELIGNDYKIDDISSFEKLFEIIKNDENFKFKNLSNEILKECAKSLKEKENRLDFPAELNDFIK